MNRSEIKKIPTHNTQAARIVLNLEKEFGPEIMKALNDPQVTDIHANPDGGVWVERKGGSGDGQITTLSELARESIIKLVATSLDKTANKDFSTIGGELPLLGARFEGVLPPMAYPGPGFSIRKKAVKIFTFKDYIDSGILTLEMHKMLLDAISNYDNMIIAGGTGTGKTTFINAYVDGINQLFPNDRLLFCEDVNEIQSSAPNKFKVIANKQDSLKKCINTALRLSPRRIIVGEIREAEQAKEAFQAWNTGHKGGIFSLHANSALDVIPRLEDLCKIAFQDKCERTISRTVDKILFIKKVGDQRKIQEFYKLEDFDFSTGKYNLTDLINNQTVKF